MLEFPPDWLNTPELHTVPVVCPSEQIELDLHCYDTSLREYVPVPPFILSKIALMLYLYDLIIPDVVLLLHALQRKDRGV